MLKNEIITYDNMTYMNVASHTHVENITEIFKQLHNAHTETFPGISQGLLLKQKLDNFIKETILTQNSSNMLTPSYYILENKIIYLTETNLNNIQKYLNETIIDLKLGFKQISSSQNLKNKLDNVTKNLMLKSEFLTLFFDSEDNERLNKTIHRVIDMSIIEQLMKFFI